MATLTTFVIATRPKTLIASASPVLLGSCLAFSKGAFSLWIFFFTLLTALAIQVGTNFVNDLFDYLKGADTANRKGPLRVTASGLVTVDEMKKLTTLVLGTILLFGLPLALRGGIAIVFLLALAILLAVSYTTGPFPIAYLGIAEIFILVFFGPVATGYTYFLQTLSFAPEAFLIGLGPGLISCALLVVNNVRDIEQDRVVKKQTLVVRFGAKFGKWEFSLALIIAPLLCLFLIRDHPFSLLTLFLLVPAFSLSKKMFQIKEPRKYNQLMGKMGKFLFLYTVVFALGLLL